MTTLAAVLLIAIPTVSAEEPLEESPQRDGLRVTTKRDNDRVTIAQTQGGTTIAIHSPMGISSATVARTGRRWPSRVILRLHLQGLENLDIAAGDTRLVGFVQSHSGYGRFLSRKTADGEQRLDKNDPLWMDIRAADKTGKSVKGLPPKDGFFEMQLPPALFEDNPAEIKIAWIDFYR